MPTAEGKVTTARLAVGDRVMVTYYSEKSKANGDVIDWPAYWAASSTKIKNAVVLTIAEIETVKYGRTSGRAIKGSLEDGQTVELAVSAPAQTFWRAPEANVERNESMTVTVKRGATRPAANANRARHAQRTPLPPKGTEPTDVEQTTRARRKAVTGSEESPNPVRKAPASRAAKPAAKVAAPAKAVPAKKTAAKAAPSKSSAIPADFPGAAKLQRLSDGAKEHGWKFAASWEATSATVVLGRGTSQEGNGELITVSFLDGKLDLARMPEYTASGRTVKLRNVSQVLSQMEGGRLAVKVTPSRKGVSSETARASRKSGATKPAQGRGIPFDPKGASDETVLDALRGHKIRWVNKIANAVEEAVMAATRTVNNPEYGKPGEPKSIERPAVVKIEEHPSRDTRTVTFTDYENGVTRSVALDRIIEVL